ncbi:hypothetical protein RHO13_05790 [Orbus wheelerorum]|uniref:hypothetical protein n=1 Tax=Orbus wheelerorum TaxID=3074111 RepID=UPI00370D71F4
MLKLDDISKLILSHLIKNYRNSGSKQDSLFNIYNKYPVSIVTLLSSILSLSKKNLIDFNNNEYVISLKSINNFDYIKQLKISQTHTLNSKKRWRNDLSKDFITQNTYIFNNIQKISFSLQQEYIIQKIRQRKRNEI